MDDRDLSDTLTEADAVPAIRMPTSEPLLGQLPARRRIRLRTILAFTTFVLIVAALAVGAVGGLYWAHFVGVDPATGRVAVFQGVPFEINKQPPAVPARLEELGRGRVAPAERAQASVRPQAALVERRRARPATAPGDRALMLARLATARNRELVNLSFLAVLTVAGFTAVLVARSGEVSSTSLVYAGLFLALFLVAHIALRMRLPQADPYLLPLVGILASVGLCEIYRIRPALARDQALWIAIGVAVFVAVLVLLPDFRVLERYRYLCGALALGLLAFTILSSYATGTVINGARVWIRVGGLSFQPAELAKVLLVLFLAGYLRERRELLAQTPTRVLGIGLPPLRQLAPLLAMLGAALLLLVAMNDFGTSLLFFGVFVALVYVATGRVAYAVIGLAAFAGGSALAYQVAPQVAERVSIWLDPWKTSRSSGYQIVQSLYTVADGGLFGSGLGRGYILTGGGRPVIPEVQTDFIYSAIAGELGLAGAAALLLCYILIAYRGFKIASRAGDGFSKLVATGLTLTLSLQAFLIVGGVVRVVPLTGITLPFVSYGGSSIVSNFLLLALLLAVSDRASRQASAGGRW